VSKIGSNAVQVLNGKLLRAPSLEHARRRSRPARRGRSDGVSRLDLPPALAASYGAAGDVDIFAVRGTADKILAASPPGFGEIAAKWPAATDEPSYFHLKGFGPSARDYYGLTILRGSPAGPVSVSVARAAEADVLVHSLLREFVFELVG